MRLRSYFFFLSIFSKKGMTGVKEEERSRSWESAVDITAVGISIFSHVRFTILSVRVIILKEVLMKYSATKLRQNLYHLLDMVIEDGTVIEIERKGHILKIVPETPLS